MPHRVIRRSVERQLFGIILTVYVLSTLQDVLIPVAFSVIIAILLNPFVNKLKRYKLSNALAIGQFNYV